MQSNPLTDALRRLAEARPEKFSWDDIRFELVQFKKAEHGGEVVIQRASIFKFTQDNADAILAELGYWWECDAYVSSAGNRVWRWRVRDSYFHARAGGEMEKTKHACAIEATIAAINFHLEAK